MSIVQEKGKHPPKTQKDKSSLKKGNSEGDASESWSVVLVRNAEELGEHVAAWDDLAVHALEPNPFYESWMFLPALRAFAVEEELEITLVYGPDPRRPFGPGRLCGFFPLQTRCKYKGLPLRHRTLWKHPYCFLCTPLLRAQVASESLQTFLDWLANQRRGALVEFNTVHGEGPFQHLLGEHFLESKRLYYPDETYSRAFFQPRIDLDTYLRASLNSKRRTELKRLFKRLGGTGQLEQRVLQPTDDPDTWIEDFLHLEGLGWKGEQGTALGAKETDRAFFRYMARAGFKQDRLMLLGLYLDGAPIALKCNLLVHSKRVFHGNEESGVHLERGAFAFKIAYDEAFARYSPGVQLELINMEYSQEMGLAWMDSCAVAQHFMINRLWRERRSIQTLMLATGRGPGDLVVSLLPMMRWLKRTWSWRQQLRRFH